MLNVSARAVSLRVQPLSGSRTPPSPRRGGGPQPYGSATLGSKPWPAPYASPLRAVTGITNRSLRALMTGLLGVPYAMTQASYDLARLRRNGLITRRPHTNTYDLTADGLRFAHLLHQGARPPPHAPSSPPTNPRPHPSSAPHCTPSTNTSTDNSTTPDCPNRRLKLGSTVKPLATKDRYAAAGTSPGSGGPSGSFTSRVRVVS